MLKMLCEEDFETQKELLINMHFLPNSNSGKDFNIFMGIDIGTYFF